MVSPKGTSIVCSFCLTHFELAIPHFFGCDSLFDAIRCRFPVLAWMDVPSVRVLHLFSVGASEESSLLALLLIDAIWAAYLASKRFGTHGLGSFFALLDAMARVSRRGVATIAVFSAPSPPR